MSYTMPNTSANAMPWDCYTDALGRVYYYNKTNKQVFLYTMNGLIDTNSPWKRLKNEHGKVFYSNNFTKHSQWTKPEGFVDISTLTEAKYVVTPYGYAIVPKNTVMPQAINTAQNGVSLAENTSNSSSIIPLENEQHLEETPQEIIASFEQMLEEMDIKHDLEWEQVIPAVEGNDRFLDVRTKDERKRLFLIWKQRKKQENLQDKGVTKEKKDSKTRTKEITPKTRPRDVEQLLKEDKRFKAIDNSDLRKKILKEYSKKLLKSELKEKRRKRIDQMDQLEAFLRDNTEFSADTQWGKVLKMVKGQPFCSELTDEDIWEVTEDLREDFELRLRAIDGETADKKYVGKQFEERARTRNDFRKLLEELLKAGRFNSKSEFSDIKNDVRSDERYRNLESQEFKAVEIFDDFCRNFHRVLRRDKRVFRSLLKSETIKINAAKNVDENEQMVLAINIDYLTHMKSLHRRTIIWELLEDLRGRDRKRQAEFVSALKRIKLGRHDSWERVREKRVVREAGRHLEEKEKRSLFREEMRLRRST